MWSNNLCNESHDETITVFTKLVIACYSLLIIG